MDISPLIIRLEELTKNKDLEQYILFRDFFMSQGGFLELKALMNLTALKKN